MQIEGGLSQNRILDEEYGIKDYGSKSNSYPIKVYLTTR